MNEKIRNAQIILAVYSRSRVKGKRPYGGYCSIRDFADGATVEIFENRGGFDTSIAYFTVDLKKIAADEVPAFMVGHPIEND
jgi:hypothetical protein